MMSLFSVSVISAIYSKIALQSYASVQFEPMYSALNQIADPSDLERSAIWLFWCF